MKKSDLVTYVPTYFYLVLPTSDFVWFRRRLVVVRPSVRPSFTSLGRSSCLPNMFSRGSRSGVGVGVGVGVYLSYRVSQPARQAASDWLLLAKSGSYIKCVCVCVCAHEGEKGEGKEE